MDGLTDARRLSWTPPARPDWVTRVNEEGACLDLDALIPLDEPSLLEAARRRTGLDDFGDTEWYESFQIFIKSLREEAQLNLMGRLMTRSDLINFLSARLQIEETYRLHPVIEEEAITAPIMILGQARTGTSLLLNVLSEDPDLGTLKHWECVFPCPPPEKATYLVDPRIDRVEQLVQQWNRVNPALPACHEFHARIPTEGSHAMNLNFAGSPFLTVLGQTATHAIFQHRQGVLPGLRYMKRLLKLLQWKNPRKHWVLKAPDAIAYMPDLLQVFPDMGFVWTHRDPLKAVDSVVNMVGNITWIRSDEPMIGGTLEQLLDVDLVAAGLDQAIEWLESGVVPKERLCNLRFLDLERDPVGEVEKMYRQFDMPLSSQAVEAMKLYMSNNPRSARPPATYSVTKSDRFKVERSTLARYQDYFQIPSEF